MSQIYSGSFLCLYGIIKVNREVVNINMVYTKELAIKEINRLKKIFTKPSVEAKKDKDLVNWINKEIEKNYPNLNESLSAKMWLVLHEGYKLICPYGNKRKFCRRSRNEPQFNSFILT